MAVRIGEELLLSAFVDVHYYFSPPQAKPLHHRFDKGSYFYVFRNSGTGQIRAEIANNAGTPDQDAVSGYLKPTDLDHSVKHLALVTINVGDDAQGASGATQSHQPDHHQWYLPALDHRNERRDMFRLRSVDLYFWAKEDALSVVELVKTIPSSQVKDPEEQRSPISAHGDVSRTSHISPVVQQLENMAVTGPEVKQDVPGHESSPSANSPRHSDVQAPAGIEQSRTQSPQQSVKYVLEPYNPAAPAAPEPIRPREKTPPPADAADGTGLHQAVAQDAGRRHMTPALQHQDSFLPTPPHLSHQASFPGPPRQQPSYGVGGLTPGPYQGSQASPAPPAGPYAPPSQNTSFAPYAQHDPSLSSASQNPSYPATALSNGPFHPSQSPQISATSPYSLPPPSGAFVPPPAPGSGYASGAPQYFSPMVPHGQDPAASPYGAIASPAAPGTTDGGYRTEYPPQSAQPYQNQHGQQYPSAVPLASGQPGSQPSPYSNHQYGQPQQQIPPGHPSSIHSQAYKPTAAEMPSQNKPPGSMSGTAKLEKGVGRFLKKIEKKIG